MESDGLSPNALSLLRAMYEQLGADGTVDPVAVADRLGLDRPALTRALTELEDDRLVSRQGLEFRYSFTAGGRARARGRHAETGGGGISASGGSTINIAGRDQASTAPVGGRLWEHPWIVILGGVVAALVAAAIVGIVSRDEDAREPDRGSPSQVAPESGGRTIEIYNKVTNGRNAMREDPKPLRLFTSPAVCGDPACLIDKLKYRTGNRISGVICQTRGQEVLNSDETSNADDRNDGRYVSETWYGVRLDDGRLAYFSDVWARPDHRGGLGLPDCSVVSG